MGATYTSVGSRRIKTRVIYTDGQTLDTQFNLQVINVTNPQPQIGYSNPINPIAFPAVPGVHSGGNLYIRYSGSNTTLIKPLIVAKGYDVSSVAPDLDRNYSIEDFLSGIIKYFNQNTNLGSFYNALENTGHYDIAFIDYNDGTDDIKRNAALFEEVVRWVNLHKIGTEPNVVMGLSMGGLVARYGLAQMVKGSENPQTRLLITQDSPHRGANTPLGLQALTRQITSMQVNGLYLGDLIPKLAEANNILDRPATQQSTNDNYYNI